MIPTKVFLILMVAFAIIALNTSKLRRAVIYLGLFSLVSSFTYLIYSAPDVAIAEAIIGSGLSTVLYLVAIKKAKVFIIYYITGESSKRVEASIKREQSKLIKKIESLLAEKELEPQTIITTDDLNFINKNKEYDLLIDQQENKVDIYGFSKDYHLDDIEKLIAGNSFKNLVITVIRYEESVIMNEKMD